MLLLTYIAAASADMAPLSFPIWLNDIHLTPTHPAELALQLWPDELLYRQLTAFGGPFAFPLISSYARAGGVKDCTRVTAACCADMPALPLC